MNDQQKIWHKGGCHCGAVSFQVAAPSEVVVAECNCSNCNQVGFQHLFAEKDEFELLTGKDDLSTYLFGTHTAKHYFCKHCGIKSFYIPRSHPDGYSVNFRCVDHSKFSKIKIEPFDGQNWEKNVDELREKH
jgi:hypothetical protein